jgi:plastocyanin
LHGKKGKESAMSMETKEEKDPAVDVEATQAHLFSRQPPTVLGRIAFWAFLGAIAQESLATGTTYTNGVSTVHMSAGSFLQSSVTIPKGSKLMLVDDVAALHILANGSWQNGVPKTTSEPGAPRVNNVQVNSGSTEIGPFSAAGTYHIYCEVHQGMNLTIIVQ